MHVATTRITTTTTAKNIKTCQEESGQLDMCNHCTTCWNVFFSFFLINRAHAGATWQAAQPKGGQKQCTTSCPIFPATCCPLPAACCLLPGHQQQIATWTHSPQPDLTQVGIVLGSRTFRISNSRFLPRSLSALCCVLSTFISSNHTVALPDIGNNPMQTTVVMVKHKLNVGYKTEWALRDRRQIICDRKGSSIVHFIWYSYVN